MAVSFYKYKFVLTGGGTGGHIMPLLASAEALRDYEVDLLYIGEKGGREEYLAKETKVPFYGIYSGKWRRYLAISAFGKNIVDLFKVVIGFFQALGILVKFKPQAVLAKGGYVSLPVVMAAWILKIPIMIHESDAVMGVSNRLTYKMATKIATGFPVEVYPHLDDKKTVFTGIPLQKDFYSAELDAKDYQFFNFQKKLPVLLITGGIQGAHCINEAIKEELPQLLENWQIVHLAGYGDYPILEQFKDGLERNKERYAPFPILGQERVLALRMANLIVSRASATTVAEIAMMGKASIIIPLENSAGGHQQANAKIYDKAGACLVIDEKRLTGTTLYETIESLRKDDKKRGTLAKAAASMAKPDAGRLLVEELLKLVRE